MFQKKSLGQNFLTSPHIIADIVNASKDTPTQTVFEIGPGKGVLTVELLKQNYTVIAIEKDDRLIPILEQQFETEIKGGQLSLIHGDILDYDIAQIPGPYKAIANIPYYITGLIIRKLFESVNQPTSITLLVQKEVADRIMARDGKESILSVSIKAYGTPHFVRTVGKGAFQPTPTVDSAVLYIDSISQNNFTTISQDYFFSIIHAGFAHKRKQLAPNLSQLFPKEIVLDVFRELNLSPKTRAEDVSVATWFQLAEKLSARSL
jgi:16S rRNA (adenine1518-N6/adenine1519-N6)-dimethyltransferase